MEIVCNFGALVATIFSALLCKLLGLLQLALLLACLGSEHLHKKLLVARLLDPRDLVARLVQLLRMQN